MTLFTMKHLIFTAIALSMMVDDGVYAARLGFQMNDLGFDMPPDPPQHSLSSASSPLTLSSSSSLPSSASLVQSEVMLLDQLLAAANENRDAYMELQNLHRREPNYLVKWPGLRDLLLTAVDYDNNNNNVDANDIELSGKNYEIANSRLMERLRQLAETSSFSNDLENTRENAYHDDEPKMTATNDVPIQNQMHFKSHGTKKNIQLRKQFMAPCHFKVCYMGPKRNARYE